MSFSSMSDLKAAISSRAPSHLFPRHLPEFRVGSLSRRSSRKQLSCTAISIPVDSGGPFLGPQVPGEQRAPTRSSRDGEQSSAVRANAEDGQKSRRQARVDDGIQTSLFAPFDGLPPDGRSISKDEETCDPEERRCKTPVHVWEVKCKACYGTGQATARGRRGSRNATWATYTCLACHGIGFVRRASTRVIPDLENGAYTIARNADADSSKPS